MNLKTSYLILAVLGAIIPYVFFIDFFSTEGLSVTHFIASWFVNGAAGGGAADLIISSLVFWVYMFSRKNNGPKPWAFIAMNLFIGLSCALPTYLWATTGQAQGRF